MTDIQDLADTFNPKKEAYRQFKQKMDKEFAERKRRAEKRADKAYNEGLWEGLPWHKKHYYLILKR